MCVFLACFCIVVYPFRTLIDLDDLYLVATWFGIC